MRRRLIFFTFTLVILFLGLEWFVRANEAAFESLSSRVLFRIQILTRSPPDTSTVFVGTSRFADAIDQSLISKEFGSRAFNAGTAGIVLPEILQFCEAASRRESLSTLVVEASSVAMSSGNEKEDADLSAESHGEEVDRFADRIEHGLQQRLRDHLAVVRCRKALRPKSLLDLAILYSANVVDPGTWSRKGLIRGWFAAADFDVPAAQFDSLHPIRFGTGEPPSNVGGRKVSVEEVKGNPVYAGMRMAHDTMRDSTATIVWVNPPVRQEVRSESGRLRKLVYQEIAEETGSIVLDYSRLPLDAAFFRDPTHLNEKGRKLFSRLLARDLAEIR
ncbi:MAG: hypothetical protein KDN18_12990 [Verrucomicrobiae bacterium]|nr:hypothetical protein [Verrucomicrobiae bacterium]